MISIICQKLGLEHEITIGLAKLRTRAMRVITLSGVSTKFTSFLKLLIALSISDTFLISFFMITSVCVTVSGSEPEWFTVSFSKILWPLGNICITVSVLLVVAVSTERYLVTVLSTLLSYRAKDVLETWMRPGVNFINVLRAQILNEQIRLTT